MYKHQETTQKIIKAFYRVYNNLGYGFLEKVYENAMMIELRKQGIDAVQQSRIDVYYEAEIVGDYFADLLVDGKVLVELKAANQIAADHEAQLLNYLKATQNEVGLILNFGPKPQIARKIYDNDRKGMMSWLKTTALSILNLC